jgi:UDP-GlcNAc:undecaprenyl-phosphate GlcNAc-1-phosphate transferase
LTGFYPIVAFLITVAALFVGRRLALRCGFADKPGGRKQHDAPVPPIGGLVILPVAFAMCWLAGLEAIMPWPLAAGIGMLLVMGGLDDAFNIKPALKFTIMVWTACFVVIFGEAQIVEVGNLFGFGPVELGILSKPFTIMCLVLLMNALNMMDGVDGLAGGFCALVVFWMLVVCLGAGNPAYVQTLTIILAALMGFLVFNMRAPWRKSASVFLGDSGSLCLGLLLGWFCIRLTQNWATPPLQPATVIWIIALPVMDAFALFLARSLRGKHPFDADRRHLHHRLMDAGLTPGQTTIVMLSIVAVMALTGFIAQAHDIPPVLLFAVWMILFIIHTMGLMHPRGGAFLSRNSK